MSPTRNSRCSGDAPDEQLDGCGIEAGLGGGDGCFEVLGEASVVADPGEEALDDPAPRMHGEADLPKSGLRSSTSAHEF